MTDYPFLTTGLPFAGSSDPLERLIAKGMSSIMEYDRGGRLYASSSAYCARQTTLYAMDSGASVLDAAGKAYMELGNAIETIVLDSLFRQRVLLFKQYRLPDIGVNMGGKIDAVICMDDVISLIEIKSCGELPSKPQPAHKAQALMYNAVCGIPASVLYFSRHVADYKGNLKMKNFPLDATPEEIRHALYTATYAHYAVQAGVVPMMPDFKSKSLCGFCKFIQNCWDGLPFTIPAVKPSQHAELVDMANAKVDELLDPDSVKARRSGILKFISANGTPYAKDLLRSVSW